MHEKSRNHRTRNALLAAGAVVSLSALIPVATEGQNHTEGHSVDLSEQGSNVEAYAQTIQDTLDRGEPASDITILLHNEFVINQDAQERVGIDKIYVPMDLGGGKYGYANVDQETGEVDIHLVDTQDGTLVQPDTSGKFAPFVGEIQVQTSFSGKGYVLAVTDPLQMFVGQAIPHIEDH